MYSYFGGSNIVVIDFSANKGWTTVPTPRSIEERSMMEKKTILSAISVTSKK